MFRESEVQIHLNSERDWIQVA